MSMEDAVKEVWGDEAPRKSKWVKLKEENPFTGTFKEAKPITRTDGIAALEVWFDDKGQERVLELRQDWMGHKILAQDMLKLGAKKGDVLTIETYKNDEGYDRTKVTKGYAEETPASEENDSEVPF